MMAVTHITWTRFMDRSASSARELQHGWSELVEHLQHAGPYSAKSLCPWIKLATFGQVRSGKGALRHDSNLLQITGVEGDYDGEQMQPEEAVALLERAGLRALVYTSPSHKPDAPRWRVLAPLAEPAAPTSRTALLARVNGALGGVLTDESFTLSQSYYYGRVAGQADYRVLVTFGDPGDGECVDDAHQLDEIAIAKAPRVHAAEGGGGSSVASKVEQLGRRLRTGDGRRELLKSYIGDKSNRGLSADEIRTLVDDVVTRFFDPADPVDWSNINGLITDITGSDAAERAQVQAVVGGFVEALPKPAPMPQGYVLSVAELHERAGALTWAVKGVIPERGIGFIFGASGTFKSFLALDYALHRAYGMKWLGRRTKQAVPIYLAAEGGAGLIRRIEAWHMARGMDWRKCPMRVVVIALTLRTQAAALRAAIEATGVQPGDIVIDTMSQTFTGNENSNDEVSDFLRVLGAELRDGLGCTVTVVHHTGHSATERPRGASAIIANVDFSMGVFRDEKQMLSTVEFVKVKDGERPEPAVFELTAHQLGKDEDGDPITSLAARHINNAQELLQAVGREARGGGRNQILLGLVQNGMPEKELRKAFYEDADIADPEARKKAFYRARDWAVSQKLIEIAQGFVIDLRRPE